MKFGSCALRGLVTFAFATSCAMAAHRAVVLTTDVGADMDDQWALAHLVLSPDVDVRAVVTTHTGQYPVLAPPAAESSARIARDVLGHLPPREAAPPVIAGSSVALSSRAPLDNAGVQRIVSESRTFTADHRLVVLVIGAATDTASALLVDRGLHERIEIVAMGFNTCADGGDVFNVRNDPIAWQVILDSDVPVTIGDSSVTKRDLAMTSERAHALLEPAGDSGRYLAQLLDEWLATRKGLVEQLMGDAKSWPVWDEVTVAHLLGMTTVEHRTRPMLGADLAFSARPSSATISCVTAIDAPHLWSDLAQRLRTASAAGARR